MKMNPIDPKKPRPDAVSDASDAIYHCSISPGNRNKIKLKGGGYTIEKSVTSVTTDTPPTVQGRIIRCRRGPLMWHTVEVVCPYCGHIHVHAGGNGTPEQADGHREAHCGRTPGYIVRVSNNNKPDNPAEGEGR